MIDQLKYSHKKLLSLLLASLFFIAASAQKESYKSFSFKYTNRLNQALQSRDASPQRFIIAAKNLSQLTSVIDRSAGLKVISIDTASNSAIILCKPKYIEEFLPLAEIIFIDVPAVPHTETGIIGYNRSFHGINTLDYTIPNANGKGRVVGVKEQKMEEADLDLFKRVLPSSLAASTVSMHATVISSIIGGAGNSFYDGRGIANACKFYSSSFNNLFPDDVATLNSNNVTVQNHSYGTVIQQFYGAEAVSYDAQTWANKNLVHVFFRR